MKLWDCDEVWVCSVLGNALTLHEPVRWKCAAGIRWKCNGFNVCFMAQKKKCELTAPHCALSRGRPMKMLLHSFSCLIQLFHPWELDRCGGAVQMWHDYWDLEEQTFDAAGENCCFVFGNNKIAGGCFGPATIFRFIHEVTIQPRLNICSLL